MNHVKLFLCVEALACVATGVKVDMQGSFSLGKDVIDTISHYVAEKFMTGRRSFIPAPIEDPITLAVKNALLCKDLAFCQQQLHFVNEYVTVLAKAVESVIVGTEPNFNTERFEVELKYSLEFIRNILEDANANVDEDKAAYYWIHTLKRINAKLQDLSDVLTTKHNEKAQRDLQHKLVIATAFVERKYELKLCAEHRICENKHECTSALNKLLTHFKSLSEDKIRSFVKWFYGALYGSGFYSHLSQSTAHEFQVILNDMSYSNDTQTRDILLSVQKTVDARLGIIQANKAIQVSHDVLVAHVILSDIDHMFSNRIDPFIMFLNQYYDWLASGVNLERPMRTVIMDIAKQISLSENDLVLKLIKEVKAFLEMTVGPEK